jgi:tetratricopeptide (TPR) repeat protein
LVIDDAADSLSLEALELARDVSVSSGQYYPGIRLAERVLKVDSTSVKARSVVAELMITSGRPEEAIEFLGGASNVETLDPLLQIQIARAFLGTDNDRAASNTIKRIEKSLSEDDPNVAMLRLEQAEAWFSGGEYGDAREAFSRVAEDFAGTDWEDEALFGVAKCEIPRENYEAARKTLQDIVSRFPSSALLPAVYLKLGSAYFLDEMYAEARDSYALSARTAVSPGIAADAFFNLSLACERLSDWQCTYDAALKVLETSAPLDLRASAVFKAGYALQELGRYEEAIDYYRQALSGAGSELSAEIRYWMGECYAAMGEFSLAVSEFLKVAYLYAGEGMWGVTAELRAASVYEKTGEINEAIKIYNKVIDKHGRDSIWGKTAAEKLAAMSDGN